MDDCKPTCGHEEMIIGATCVTCLREALAAAQEALSQERAARVQAEADRDQLERNHAEMHAAFTRVTEMLTAARAERDAAVAWIGNLGKRAEQQGEQMEPCDHGDISKCAPCLLAQLIYERDVIESFVTSENRAIAERDVALARAAASDAAAGAMREALTLWSTLYREGFTQKVCDRIGLGLEHVRGGAPVVMREVLRRVDAALATDAGRAFAERMAAAEALTELVCSATCCEGADATYTADAKRMVAEYRNRFPRLAPSARDGAKEHCPRRLMGEDQPPHAPCDTGDHSRDGEGGDRG